MGRFGTNQTMKRVEDVRLLTGKGRYTDDIAPADALHMAVVRSPHAHGKILSIDTEAAKAMPGVSAVYTIADLDSAGINPVPNGPPVPNRDGTTMAATPRPVLARDKVRYVGEPIAVVIAATPLQAKDAAEAVMVDVEPLNAAGTIAAAAADGAPLLFDDIPGNRAFDWEMGDEAGTSAAFDKATHVVPIDLVNNRIAPTSIEPRACLASHNGETGETTFWVGSQGAHMQKMVIGMIMGLEADQLRVITEDVGGGFGMKIFVFPEYIAAIYAARTLGATVKWTADRSEAFMADTHGRDHLSHAELALDGDGKILGLRVHTKANLGGYVSPFGSFVPTMAGCGMLCGVYAIPVAYVRVEGILSNSAPTDAYRGAGRPEAAYLIERIVDAAGRATGLGPAEIRRRNFITPDAMPFTTALGKTYDSGEFAALMDEAMAKADWDGFAARKAASAAKGMLRGLGMSYYVEACAFGSGDKGRVAFEKDGTLSVYVGTQSNGQGHETAYTQMVAAETGVDPSKIKFIQGDTKIIPSGGGTGGSRSIPVGGQAVNAAVTLMIETGKQLAADMLDVPADQISFDAGLYRSPGTNQTVRLEDVAAHSFTLTDLPEDIKAGLDTTGEYNPTEATYPNGCHIVEVEIDPDTGMTRLDRYSILDDVGVTVNPMLLEGQIIGGAAQGIGQALCEEAVYDPESGQLLSGTLMDYTMPRADLMPDFQFATRNVPCTTNPMGIKGAGEAGTIGAPPAVINAIVDALAPMEITHVDMPATPYKIWTLIQQARGAAAA